jgi:U3 small nucleolar RNA-associated protein 22
MILGWIVNGGDVGVKGDRSATKRTRGLGKGLGAWGALRAAWEFLANTDFAGTPVFMANEGDAIPHTEFTETYSDVFVDPSGTVNIIGEWERGDIELVRHYARETLAMLEDSNVDRFADVFLHNQTLGPAAFDEYLM